MLRSLTRLALVLLAATLAAPIQAQEGHPLKGSWIGMWEGNKDAGDDVLLVLNWDGKTISGIINPGTDNMKIANATLDPNGWKVHIEADGKNKQGAAVHYVIDGKVEKGSMTGSWNHDNRKGDFKLAKK